MIHFIPNHRKGQSHPLLLFIVVIALPLAIAYVYGKRLAGYLVSRRRKLRAIALTHKATIASIVQARQQTELGQARLLRSREFEVKYGKAMLQAARIAAAQQKRKG